MRTKNINYQITKNNFWTFCKENPSNWYRMIKVRNLLLWQQINDSPGKVPKEKLFNFINNTIPKVCYCGQPCRWYSDIKTNGYGNFCSRSCSGKYNISTVLEKRLLIKDQTIKKYKQTCLEKYGVDHHTKTKSFKDKLKSTCLKKYGVEFISQSQIIKDIIIVNNLKKYGVKNISQDKEIHNKQITTRIKNGNLNPDGTIPQHIINKIKKTNIANGTWFDYSNINLKESYKKYKKEVYTLTNKNIKENSTFKERSILIHVDHILSIKDGFKQQIPPNIISNLANLRLISNIENIAKGAKSLITYEELLLLISKSV